MSSSGSDHFDPYHVWLGIRKSDQPPTLYRLIGVSDYEDNMEVIGNAFLQRHTMLQAFAAGKKGEIACQLLDEVIRAKAVLLDADAKSAYDKQLREQERPRSAVPVFRAVSVRRRRSRSTVPLLLQIVVGGAVGVGGGLAILKYLVVNPVVQHEPALPQAPPVAVSNNASEETSIPRPRLARDTKRRELSSSAFDARSDAKRPVVEQPASAQPTASGAVPKTTKTPAMTIHELRNLTIELPAGKSVEFSALIPDTSALQQIMLMRINDQKRKIDKTHIAFADENGREYAYVAKSIDGQAGSLLVLNHLGTPAFVGKYLEDKRAGTVLMLDESQQVLFAGQYKNRDLNGLAVLFRTGRPTVIVDCQSNKLLAVHHCEQDQIVRTFSPAEADPFFAEIRTEMDSYEEGYLETEKTIRKAFGELVEEEKQRRVATKSREVDAKQAARRSARAAANAAAMNAIMSRIPRETRAFVLPPVRPVR